jgi:hypothetical protein
MKCGQKLSISKTAQFHSRPVIALGHSVKSEQEKKNTAVPIKKNNGTIKKSTNPTRLCTASDIKRIHQHYTI